MFYHQINKGLSGLPLEELTLRTTVDNTDAIITHAQITDAYLLGLAVHKKGKLATLDQRIPSQAVRDGRQALELILP